MDTFNHERSLSSITELPPCVLRVFHASLYHFTLICVVAVKGKIEGQMPETLTEELVIGCIWEHRKEGSKKILEKFELG